jgi:hypothetical protein
MTKARRRVGDQPSASIADATIPRQKLKWDLENLPIFQAKMPIQKSSYVFNDKKNSNISVWISKAMKL